MKGFRTLIRSVRADWPFFVIVVELVIAAALAGWLLGGVWI